MNGIKQQRCLYLKLNIKQGLLLESNLFKNVLFLVHVVIKRVTIVKFGRQLVISVWELWQPERQKTLQFENCKFGFGGERERAAGVNSEAPSSAWSKLGPSWPGRLFSAVGWIATFQQDLPQKVMFKKQLSISSQFSWAPLGPRPGWPAVFLTTIDLQ